MKGSAAACLALLLLAGSACGGDPRLKSDAKGDFLFAPVRNDIDADATIGPPVLAPGVTAPFQGFVLEQSSFGYTTAYVFDAAAGTLTGVWDEPAVPGEAAPPPEIHHFKLPDGERKAFIKLINRAWGAGHPTPGAKSVHEVAVSVWLVDGAQFKPMDGYRGGQVIDAAVTALAAKHKLVRDNHNI